MTERILASSTIDGVINTWDIYTYPVNPIAKQSWKPHNSPTVLAKLSENLLITGSLDSFNAIQLWNIQNSIII